jgi:hypothetical protein
MGAGLVARSEVLSIDLTLNTLQELFVARTVDPLIEDYPPRGDVSGVEHAINVFYAKPKYGSLELRVSLPRSEITPDVADRISTSIGRWCRARLVDVDEEIHASRWRGGRALVFGFGALFLFTGFSKILDRYDSGAWLEILSEGFNIAGWVALWFPLEVLMFSVWQHRLDRKGYLLLSEAQVQVMSHYHSVEADPGRTRSD